MTQRSSLDMLINLATDQRDEATKALGLLHGAHQQAEQQLDTLLSYRSEYQQQFDQALGRGMSMPSLRNYQRFVASLDRAIEQQRHALSSSQQQMEDGKSHWQSRQRRLKSFNVLDGRRRETHATRQARRDQQQNDEYARRANPTLNGL